VVSRQIDPAAVRAAMADIADWLVCADAPEPEPARLALAVRLTARTLAARAPGASVEVRIPPYVAVQCLPGPRHTRGTPANVVETDPGTWLRLAAGLERFDHAVQVGTLRVSGSRAAEVASWFPLARLDDNDSG
jgi:hypothetical protein